MADVFDISTGDPILSGPILEAVRKQYSESKTLNHEASEFALCLEKRLVTEMVYLMVKGVKGAFNGK